MKTRKIRILECIPPDDHGQESVGLAEIMHMCGLLASTPRHVKPSDTQASLLKYLFEGTERFIHISAHGDTDCLVARRSPKLTLSAQGTRRIIAQHSEYADALTGKFLTISACGTMSGTFSLDFGAVTGATAIVAPMAPVKFTESAVFFTMFYFALVSHWSMDESERTEERLARYIDAFQRAKTGFLSVGGGGAFRLDWWVNKRHEYLL